MRALTLSPTPAPPSAAPPVNAFLPTPDAADSLTATVPGRQLRLHGDSGGLRWFYKYTPGGKDDQPALRPASTRRGAASEYEAGKTAGCAWFDDKGEMFGEIKETHQAWVAWWKPDDWRPTGTWYLKVVGPGEMDFGLPF